jgi:hypothetical protein
VSHDRPPTECAGRPAVRDAYVTGVLSLKSEFLGPTTSDFGIPGTVQQVSTYDLFTVCVGGVMRPIASGAKEQRRRQHILQAGQPG